jgi:hypothetical protein
MKVLFNIARVSSTDKTNFWVDNVRWDTAIPGPLDKITISPNNALVPLGLPRQFTAQGFDAKDNIVDIWPNWELPAEIGSIDRTEGISTIFTASMTQCHGILEATAEGKTGQASLDISGVNFKSSTIYSDDGLRGFLGAFEGEDDTLEITEDEVISAEGTKSLRADFNVTSDGYGGWFLLAEEDDISDLTRWGDYLHFQVKTAYDLEISIRSENIEAEEGKAKIFLSDYGIPIDDTWQEVFIALPDFKQKEPNLDFSRIVIYFSVAIVGSKVGVNEIGSFWIDDVKWQKAVVEIASVEPLDKLVTTWGKVKTALYQNYPNPFNPETWIPFSLREDSPVRIFIYNQKGQQVRKLDLGKKEAGEYLSKEKAAYWDAKDEEGQRVASGVYYYTIEASDYSATKKMAIIK